MKIKQPICPLIKRPFAVLDIPLFNFIYFKIWCSSTTDSIERKRAARVEQPNEVLQKNFKRTAYGNRTRDSSVKGMRLNPLTNAAFELDPTAFCRLGSAKI